MIESSWALNIAESGAGLLCGTKAGADFNKDVLRINGERDGSLFLNKIDVNPSARQRFRGEQMTDFEYEAKHWIQSIVNDTEPLVKPREAMVVSQILEAVYISAHTGKPVYFEKE